MGSFKQQYAVSARFNTITNSYDNNNTIGLLDERYVNL